MAGPLRRYAHKSLLRRLQRLEDAMPDTAAAEAAGTATRARQLAAAAERLARAADAQTGRAGPAQPLPDLPTRTDWAVRAAFWQEPDQALGTVEPGHTLGAGTSLHHDGEADRVALRLTRASSAPSGRVLTIDTLDFSGSYLSISLPFPAAVLGGLSRQTLVRAAFTIALDRPLTTYARLNLRHGPNTGKMIRGLDTERGQEAVEFDLFYADVEPEGASELWLDLIFETPAMARIDIADAILSRRPRAGI